ncbi:hypothetical protein PCASD_21521 [Puccinia coronata f. sp. avenae]|uniref:Integrase catalytic domain-containing protein n=1 Tax=Puccinia coronata f. sp. avenae TaxID=200324 RepID=A0A2N5SPB3_9BASI|nr:hypothetical protein PCASD_21521 [Puccinia coronata f. sp. avenae]
MPVQQQGQAVEKPATQLVESMMVTNLKHHFCSSKPRATNCTRLRRHPSHDQRSCIFFPSAETNMKISTGGHSNFLTATSVGSVVLVNHQGRKKTLNNVLLVPTLSRSLLSIPRMFKEKFCIEKLQNHEVTIDIDNEFQLLASPENPNWHERLGHPNHQYLKQLIPEAVEHECDICKQCKLRALPFTGNFKNVHQVLDAVHLDLVGPFPVQSPAGYMYFLTIVDQFSGFKSVKFLRSKGETFDKFVDFKNNAEKKTGKTLRMIISDGGGEFVNEKFSQMCSSKGIAQHITPAYTPQNNGMAERANQSILVKARCLLVQSKLPKSLWTEAVNTATHLCNLTPSRTRGMRIPYNVWTGKSVSLDVLRPFGCRTYSLIPKEKREFKLNPTAEPGIMLGYENDFSTYRIYKLNKKIVVRTSDVKFDESVFPGLGGNHNIQPSDDIFDVSNHQEPAPNTGQESSNSTKPTAVPVADETHDQSVPTRVAPKDISSSISTDNILSVDRRGNSIIVYLTENVEDDTPKSYIQAINSANSSFWKKAIEKEVSNMYEHEVWVIVKKQEDQHRINCTWVFKVKKNQLNVPIEYKARLCAKGFQQIKGTDFGETYAPTGKLVSLRMLIIFALKHDLLFHQIDIKSAFLNAPLKEKIFLNPPQGVKVPEGHVLKLEKAMYRLKQAPNAWHRTLSEWLFQVGFRRCEAEPCVFWRKGTFLYLHVDDLAIFSKDPEVFKNEVKARFQIKDLGVSSLLLGMNVIQEEGAVTLTQKHYIETQLDLFNCRHLHSASTPMKPKGHLIAATKAEQMEHLESGNNYCSLVGALNYLSSTTRPDITFAVSSLSQYLNAPGLNHWEAGIQVLRYLKGTIDVGLRLSKPSSNEVTLCGYADADWASCPESRRSVSGNLILLDGNVISWKSKKQPTLSLSSTEAEYKSIGDITKEIMWIKTLLKKIFNVQLKVPTPIFEDNQGAIALANNESNHSNYKTKHMSLRHHFVRREIKIKSIALHYLPTHLMLEDFLTKAVGKCSIKRALRSLKFSCSSPVQQ